MRTWNRKHKPKFSTKTKILKFYGTTTFSYTIMKPKNKRYNIAEKKIFKSFNKKEIVTNKYRGW